MAIRALNWLSQQVGVDITGETGKESSEDIFGGIGKAVFGGEGEQDDTGIPKDDWGYEFNKISGQWEPTGNAPGHIQQEQEQRLHELSAPPPVVAPPPMMAPNQTVNYTRDLKVRVGCPDWC